MIERPVDRINLLAAMALLALTLVAAATGRLAHWPAVIGRSVVMAAGVVAMAWLARRVPAGREKSWRAIVVDFYPLVFVPAVFDTIGFLIPAINPVLRDGWLIAADRFVFGVDPTVWLQRIVRPWLSDVFFLGYCTYYFFPLVVGVAMWRRDPVRTRQFIFAIVLGFYLSYVGYFLVPARGPRFALADQHVVRVDATPISHAIAWTLDGLENTKQDAFPSGHTMITLMCLIYAGRHSRWLLAVLLPPAMLLIGATVYCWYHYVVDVAAGAALAIIAMPLGRWAYSRLNDVDSAAQASNTMADPTR